MARARNIKPSFFTNEELVELPFSTRLLFIGLWTLADREGRLEDKPKKIKMCIFPADNLDIDEALQQLAKAGFIERYTIENNNYIQIVNFKKHQHPHPNETQSVIPDNSGFHAKDESTSNQGSKSLRPEQEALGLNPFNLNPDISSFHEDNLSDSGESDTYAKTTSFENFWKTYPRREKKKNAHDIWKRKRLDRIAEKIIADVERRKVEHGAWLDGFVPHPTTYLNGERWHDEINSQRSKTVEGNDSTKAFKEFLELTS